MEFSGYIRGNESQPGLQKVEKLATPVKTGDPVPAIPNPRLSWIPLLKVNLLSACFLLFNCASESFPLAEEMNSDDIKPSVISTQTSKHMK